MQIWSKSYPQVPIMNESEIPGPEIALDFPPFPLPREIGGAAMDVDPRLRKDNKSRLSFSFLATQ